MDPLLLGELDETGMDLSLFGGTAAALFGVPPPAMVDTGMMGSPPSAADGDGDGDAAAFSPLPAAELGDGLDDDDGGGGDGEDGDEPAGVEAAAGDGGAVASGFAPVRLTGSTLEVEEVYAAPGMALRCLNEEAMWVLSSAKPGCALPELLDDDLSLYWQSDSPAPHIVTLHFPRRTTVYKVCLYLDYSADESYTPRSIGVRVGSTPVDLVEVRNFELNQPTGWVHIVLGDPPTTAATLSDVGADGADGAAATAAAMAPLAYCVRGHMLQVVVYQNHQTGRDCHIRGMRVIGPKAAAAGRAAAAAERLAAAGATAAAGAGVGTGAGMDAGPRPRSASGDGRAAAALDAISLLGLDASAAMRAIVMPSLR